MDKKEFMRILLTGDDGYNSIGTRLLVHALKNEHTLQIAATKSQQSGVGGQLSLTFPSIKMLQSD
jgi:5'/3'-nucleotidase SurE